MYRFGTINIFLISCGLILIVSAKIGTYQKHSPETIATFNRFQQPQRNPFWEWINSILGGNSRPTTTTTPSPAEPPRDCGSCTCGITNTQKRIVGGHETQVNEYPWVAQLIYGTRFYCGASLINDRYVLSAAHCVDGFNPQKIMVRLLEHNRVDGSPLKIDVGVETIVKHSQYSSSTYNNDIALIKLKDVVTFQDLVRPVCLPTPGKSFTGHTGIVTGWGATREGGQTSEYLQEVEVPIMSNSDCRASNYGPGKITDNMICAGYEQGQKDSCQGDSGGPMHVVENDRYQIAGVVSWGEGCAKPKLPGVYTRVNRFGTWISSNTKDACYCNE